VQSLTGEEAAAGQQELAGKAALIASVGDQRGWADWTNPDHRLRRLLAEFIGMARPAVYPHWGMLDGADRPHLILDNPLGWTGGSAC
jgi:hypothetical protein